MSLIPTLGFNLKLLERGPHWMRIQSYPIKGIVGIFVKVSAIRTFVTILGFLNPTEEHAMLSMYEIRKNVRHEIGIKSGSYV